jgi:ribosomal protein L11 methyltransferase
MNYIELSCLIKPVEPWSEILIAELADLGFESFTEDDTGFKAYINACNYRAKSVKELFERFRDAGPEKLSFEVTKIGSKNWNAVWESNFQAITIADRCHIRAPFHEAKPEIEYEIIIEPKMSFGTGHHETTSLVVKWLLETEIKGKSVLDMGCGTGVLAILAAKKGASHVTAIDNYLFAYENTIENAERNSISDMRILHGDAGLLGDEDFDVIIANITRNVLLEDMAAYVNVLRPGGILLLSGFLAFDKDIIFAEGSKLGLHHAGEKTLKDWVSLKLTKP